MPDIYEQHAAAFKNVSAFVVLDEGERVATIAFKFPKDSAGRLYAYVHWLGVPMVRGHATGYGYDKRTAACSSAVRHIKIPYGPEHKTFNVGACKRFIGVLAADQGPTWDSTLRDADFTVLQAV